MKIKNYRNVLMKFLQLYQNHPKGFAIMEILLLMVIIGIIGANILFLQNSTWKRTGSSNRLLIAGQMIEKQIEQLRMYVDNNPEENFPPSDSSITENGIVLRWVFLPANRPVGSSVSLSHIRKCDFLAHWGTDNGDSLRVTTYLAKNF